MGLLFHVVTVASLVTVPRLLRSACTVSLGLCSFFLGLALKKVKEEAVVLCDTLKGCRTTLCGYNESFVPRRNGVTIVLVLLCLHFQIKSPSSVYRLKGTEHTDVLAIIITYAQNFKCLFVVALMTSLRNNR